MRFGGKTALVTGSGGGIGRAVALRLAAEGAAVVVANRGAAGAEETAGLIRRAGGRAAVALGDAGDPATATAAVAVAREAFGGLDILANVAGISPVGSILDTSIELWQETLATDLGSVFYFSRAALPEMIARGGGAIINVAGTLGLHAMPRKAAYCAAKAGVVNLTRQAAIDYGPQGVRINCICPGYIDTPINAGLSQHDRDLFLAKLPLRHGGVPEDVAAAVSYLASDEAGYVTGAIVTVDGGQTTGIHD